MQVSDKKYRKGEEVTFESTGKKFCCNCGFIGINHNLELSEGYDGYLPCFGEFTVKEKEELSEFMIKRWKQYAGLS